MTPVGSDVHDYERINGVERTYQREAGRNIAALVPHAAGTLAAAARNIVEARNPSVVVLTGAFIPWATPPAAETDGPPGAALLASGLQDLGIPARLLTDYNCKAVVAAARDATSPALPIDVCDNDSATIARILQTYERTGVAHVVAVERIGPARDGVVRNFRGEEITASTAPVETVFDDERPWGRMRWATAVMSSAWAICPPRR